MEELQVVDHDEDSEESSPAISRCSIVDNARPFRSVKEAVAIFGERFLVGEIYASKPFSFPKKETPLFLSPGARTERELDWNYTDDTILADAVKELEVELEETKAELKLLKERESEMGVALASLNAELHKSMSKLAQAEAEAAAASRSGGGDTLVDRRGAMTIATEEVQKKRDACLRGSSPSLAQILSIGEREGWYVIGRKKVERKVMKKKPIVPLVGDLFSRKKGMSHNPLFASSYIHWN